jgi:predicted Zn-dependent protease
MPSPSVLVFASLLLAVSANAQDFSTNVTQPPPAKPADMIRAQADAALEAHDYERALKFLGPLAEANPKDAHILFDLATTQDALDQNTAAEKSYRAAIADDASFLDPHVALGLMLARAGHFDDARTELLAATITPGDALLKARAYRALARIDEKPRPAAARDELIEALKLSPETPEDALLAAELASGANGGGPAAEATYRRVLAAKPYDPAATAGLAHLLVLDKKTDEAETMLVAARVAYPDNPQLLAELASLYDTERKPKQAIPLLEQLHAAEPRNDDAEHMLAEMYLEINDYAHAEPLLGALALQRSEDTDVVDDRARALLHLNRAAEAVQILSRIVAQPKLFPTTKDFGNAAGDLAYACSENNDPAGALQALEVRATVLPISAPVLFLTAISHDKLHHTKLAVQAYKQFLQASDGNNPDQEFEARHRLIALEHSK